jgi:hypothetical protein
MLDWRGVLDGQVLALADLDQVALIQELAE